MNKYKVGDKVFILPLQELLKLESSKQHGYTIFENKKFNVRFNSAMKDFCGKVVTISGLTINNLFYIEPIISNTPVPWIWCPDWVVPVNDSINILYGNKNEV